MRWSLLTMGVAGVVSIGLISGLAAIGVQNDQKPAEITRLQEQIADETYPTVPPESRRLSSIGPAYPSPGYEN